MPNDSPVRRKPIRERWDLLPYCGLRAVAEVLHDGEAKYPNSAWRSYPHRDSDQSPLNHAIGHAMEATSMEVGSSDRARTMAKAATNLLMQIELEIKENQ